MSKNSLQPFVFIHSSQWLPGGAEKIDLSLDALMTELPSILTLTEVFTDRRHDQLVRKGYGFHHLEHTDPATLWNEVDWDVLYAETVEVTDKTYWTKDGNPTKPTKAAFVVLQNRHSGHNLLVVNTHLPPHVEGKGGPGGLWNVSMIRRWTVTITSVRGIRKKRKQLREEFDIHAQIITADWNLGIMNPAVRAWAKSVFPLMTPNFPITYRGIGSLGKRRVIDWSLLRGLVVTGGPDMKSVPGTDHRRARTILRFKRPVKRTS